ncbi:MAG: sigma-70 family RNA polymerase sigma factor [Nannocystaceae bacterium]|nr:sigma-70 family RNA polymerase sigma factor [Nannocystaceae bacterium]
MYRDHFGLLWSTVHHMGVSDAHREDVLQEVWLCVFRRMHTLDPTASTKAWLCSIARNVVLHHHRSGYRQRRKLASLAQLPGRDSDDPSRQHDARSTVRRVLEGMDKDQRSVLVLAQVHGLSGPEIAAGLGIPLNTTYSRLRLARRYINEIAANDDDIVGLERPPAGAAKKSWALLLPCLPQLDLGAASVLTPAAGPTAAVKFALASKAIAASLVVGAAALALAAIVDRPGASPPVATDAAPTDSQAAASIPTPAEATPVSVVPPHGTAAVTGAESAPAPKPNAAKTRKKTKKATKNVSPKLAPALMDPVPVDLETVDLETVAPALKDTDAPNMPAGLSQEAELVRAAQEALRSGHTSRALALLGEHREQFPSGQLADAREGVWVRTLCQAGRGQEARARASKLAKQSPGSAVAAAVGDVCQK